MRTGLGQQALAGLAVLLLVGITLVGGFVLMQSDAAVRLGDISPVTVQPSATFPPTNTATYTPTSAIMEGLEATALPTDELLFEVTVVTAACAYPSGWQPVVVGQSDSIDSLAARYATTAQALMESNCLDEPTLEAGQILYVPPMATGTEEACGPPAGWTTYVVMPEENLFRIGLRYGQTVDAMMQANCLTSSQVKVGQTLFVPPVTPKPSALSTSAAPVEGTPTLVSGCDNPGAQITAPIAGEVLVGDILFYGTANVEKFSFYKLETRPAGGGDYVTFGGGGTPVTNDYLGRVGAYAFVPGDYVVRLAVVDITGTIVGRCSITVTLEGGPTATPIGG